MARALIGVGALLGALGVVAGAFGAHALKARLAPDLLVVFETGARYHLVHAVAVVAAGLLAQHTGARLAATGGWLMVAGVLVFSGSLYLLALSGQRWLGAVTPLGGLALIAGWAVLALAAFRG